MSADFVSPEFGDEVSVVYEICESVAAEKAVEGRPSLAASHAAPLPRCVSQKFRELLKMTYTVPEFWVTVPRLSAQR